MAQEMVKFQGYCLAVEFAVDPYDVCLDGYVGAVVIDCGTLTDVYHGGITFAVGEGCGAGSLGVIAKINL